MVQAQIIVGHPRRRVLTKQKKHAIVDDYLRPENFIQTGYGAFTIVLMRL